jgi:hypothetical protein
MQFLKDHNIQTKGKFQQLCRRVADYCAGKPVAMVPVPTRNDGNGKEKQKGAAQDSNGNGKKTVAPPPPVVAHRPTFASPNEIVVISPTESIASPVGHQRYSQTSTPPLTPKPSKPAANPTTNAKNDRAPKPSSESVLTTDYRQNHGIFLKFLVLVCVSPL